MRGTALLRAAIQSIDAIRPRVRLPRDGNVPAIRLALQKHQVTRVLLWVERNKLRRAARSTIGRVLQCVMMQADILCLRLALEHKTNLELRFHADDRRHRAEIWKTYLFF